MFTDTHAHLDFPEFQQDLPDILNRAQAADISRIISISTSIEASERAISFASNIPSVFAAVGIHPCYVDESPDDFLPKIRALAEHPKVVAIGETGIDYHRTHTPPEQPTERASWLLNRKRQADFFQQHLDLACETKLNVVVHQRDSWDDTLAILRPYSGRLSAVYHCFGGSYEQAKSLIDLGFYVSFTGIVTFKNATAAQDAATRLPKGSFFLETDCPFLAPVPHRGKRCEPAFTRYIAEHIAKLRNESLEELSEHTETAVSQFFKRRL